MNKRNETILDRLESEMLISENELGANTLSLGEVLWNMAEKRFECNGNEGQPIPGIPMIFPGQALPRFPTAYMQVIADAFGGSVQFPVMMQVFKALDEMQMIRRYSGKPLQGPLTAFNRYGRMSLTPEAIALAKMWGKNHGKNIALLKDKSIAEVRKTFGPEAALERIIDLKPELELPIRKKQSSASSGGSEGSKAEDWIDTVTRYPFDVQDRGVRDPKKVEATLRKQVYGMDEVVEALLDFVNVRKFGGNNQGGILLLVGPPGVGKTHLVKPLAEALGRKYAAISLSGQSDPAVIKGHGYTYIGAEPGEIVNAALRTGTSNPVVLLDEVDKADKHYGGDALKNALVPLLDPTQNNAWGADQFMKLPFDMSKVLWVLTANDESVIPDYLRNRVTTIRLNAYMPGEKLEIAKRFVLPKLLKKDKIPAGKITFTDDAIMHLIHNYTSESGVRQLEKRMARLIARASREIDRKTDTRVVITPDYIDDKKLAAKISKEPLNTDEQRVGVVNGLFYSTSGGGVLPVQVSALFPPHQPYQPKAIRGSRVAPGPQNPAPVFKGGLEITGQLGDVMQESMKIGYSVLKKKALAWKVSSARVEALRNDRIKVNVHFPDGATPKDGPSAGIAGVVAMWSAISGVPVPANMAITGETDLFGRDLPIGGILEKLSGAARMGVNRFYLSKVNRRQVEELCTKNKEFAAMADSVAIKFVDSADEVIADILSGEARKGKQAA